MRLLGLPIRTLRGSVAIAEVDESGLRVGTLGFETPRSDAGPPAVPQAAIRSDVGEDPYRALHPTPAGPGSAFA
jgi:hypothetical protein